MKKYPVIISMIIYMLSATCVLASSSDISVNNQVTEDEQGFSAEELNRFLERSGDRKEKDKNWRDYLTVSGNKEDKGDSEIETVSENSAGKTEEEQDYYIPDREDEWKLILVNKQNPIPNDYDAELVDIYNGSMIRREIAVPLADMFEAAADDGVKLTVCSAYRDHEYQERLFDKKIRTYTKRGMSYLDAFRIGSYSVIIPGTSEHELGMALDIVTPGYMSLDDGFADTAAGKWLKKNAYKFGFILRYPEGKEYITGITFEPWHYRYVGEEAAEFITKKGLTLEEYIEGLKYHR
ncbi:MAG: M15 family metallopeptidase [Lachnospiraceae bacterium]|nr:M15 family metallopeptidase [Lachnospiraceae bacterium]